ncbi:MAG TPA: hypothetical protein VF799_12105 [Geobacteraceae bacterium]
MSSNFAPKVQRQVNMGNNMAKREKAQGKAGFIFFVIPAQAGIQEF